MMHDPMEELQAYYVDPFSSPTTLVQMEIFQNDDAILEKLRALREFLKYSEKRLVTWFMQH